MELKVISWVPSGSQDKQVPLFKKQMSFLETDLLGVVRISGFLPQRMILVERLRKQQTICSVTVNVGRLFASIAKKSQWWENSS